MNRLHAAALIGALALSSVATALAQSSDQPPQAPQTVTVTVDGWDYDLDSREPLTLYANRITTGNEGGIVAPLIFWRNADGTITRLTACDDVAVLCAPLYTQASAALSDAAQGDAYVLGDEVINGRP